MSAIDDDDAELKSPFSCVRSGTVKLLVLDLDDNEDDDDDMLFNNLFGLST